MLFRYLTSAAILSLAAGAAHAEAAPETTDTTITVLATGRAQKLGETGQTISVVGLEEIQSVQGPDLTRVLTRLPGISVARAGGLGATTSLFVRGANSEQLLVTLDGVRVEDVAAPSGGYDFGGLMSGGIGKLELLRGSNSVVWGANAIGGVLAITSRELNGAEASVEHGSNASWDANASAGIKRDAYAVNVNAGYTRTTGIPTRTTDTLPNGLRQWHFSGRARYTLAQGLDLVANGRFADSRVGIDSYAWPVGYLNRGEKQSGEQASGRVGLDYSGEGFGLKGGVAVSSLRRGYLDPTVQSSEYSSYLGRSTRADLSGHVALPAGFALDAGGTSEWSHARNFYFTPGGEHDARLSSLYALLGQHEGRLDLNAGLRMDDHSTFGTHWTFGANGALRIVQDVRLRASYGEGFKAPTLYQLYDSYSGSKDLLAETSKSYDIALEKGDRNGRIFGAVTWFHRDVTNQIDYNNTTFRYSNLGKTRAEGFEVEGGLRPVPSLQLRGAYTYVKSTSQSAGSNFGKDLARRPRHMLTYSTDWTSPLAGLALGGDIRVVSSSYDNAANTTRLAGYATLDLRASIPLCSKVELFGRVENVTKERYTVVNGYNTLGRTAAIGLRAKL